MSILIEAVCPTLDIIHGKVEGNSRRYGSKVMIRCMEGFIYTRPSASTRYCLGEGDWTGENGYCEGKF